MAAGLRWPTAIWGGPKCGERRPLRPRLKLPTQSQMANRYLKVRVQNVKLFFTQTLEHFQTWELQKISKL